MSKTDKPKRGRPVVGDKPIDERVYLRAPATDVSRWLKLAGDAGMTLSAWIRDRLNRQRK